MDGPSIGSQVDRFSETLDTGIILEHLDFKRRAKRTPDSLGIDSA
jgi:hypothetical protein